MHGPLQVEETSTVVSELQSEIPRYEVSIYDTPFSKLPNPKRVWLGSPSSALEGLGEFSFTSASSKLGHVFILFRSTVTAQPRGRLRSCSFGDQNWETSRAGLGHDQA